MNKQILRTKICHKLKQLTTEQKQAWSKKISDKVINHKLIKSSQVIALYYSTPNEVDTKIIIEYLLKIKKEVCLPRIINQHHMVMHKINSWNFVGQQNKNIKEPLANNPICLIDEIDLLIIPGLVFDQFNYRLGHGQGYYDQYLQGFNKKTIMLAFSIQKVRLLKHDKWDIPVEYVITEK